MQGLWSLDRGSNHAFTRLTTMCMKWRWCEGDRLEIVVRGWGGSVGSGTPSEAVTERVPFSLVRVVQKVLIRCSGQKGKPYLEKRLSAYHQSCELQEKKNVDSLTFQLCSRT
jgi:hypothetical protein